MQTWKTPTPPSSPEPPLEASGKSKPSRAEWMTVVREIIGKMQFGEVQIAVHKGRVVEVRTMEKTRFHE